MQKLKVEYLPIGSIKPYAGNAKLHPQEQVEQIKRSIEAFGFNDPVATWNGEIVEGHGRVLAAQELGIEKLPVIKLDGLTDEQRRGYILAHNKLTMNSGFDPELLAVELENLPELDMEQFGFEMPELEEPDINIGGYYGDERERTYSSTNFNVYDETRTEGLYDMPIIEAVDYTPVKLLGFNYAKTAKDFNVCVHFYLDDYQFERVWNDPGKYIRMLTHFEASMTPNFSIYKDMPEALKIWNTYRARLLGQMMQDHGITVVPIVYWSDERSWDYCFDGLPEGGTLSVNYIANRSEESKQLWADGMEELIKRKTPKRVLLYGNGATPEYDFGDVEIISFKNTVTERMRGNG